MWLTFIMSESNHRLSHLQPWAAARSETLRAALGRDLVETDFTDDRLAQALDYLNDDEGWRKFEDGLNRHTIRIYDLNGELVRLDSTTAKSYGKVTADGTLALRTQQRSSPRSAAIEDQRLDARSARVAADGDDRERRKSR